METKRKFEYNRRETQVLCIYIKNFKPKKCRHFLGQIREFIHKLRKNMYKLVLRKLPDIKNCLIKLQLKPV